MQPSNARYVLCALDPMTIREFGIFTMNNRAQVCDSKILSASDGVKIKGQKIHKSCVRCSVCDCQLGRVGQVVYVAENELVCRQHYLQKQEKRIDSRDSSSASKGATSATT